MEKNRKPAAVKGKDWNEENNIIYFVVVSDGTNGARWFERLQREGDYVTEHAQRLLNSSSFVPSKGGVVMKIAVLRGASFCDADRLSDRIRAVARYVGFQTPSPEVACLAREKFFDLDIASMGVRRIIFMHEPILDVAVDNAPLLLEIDSNDKGTCLSACHDETGFEWPADAAFAFVVSEEPKNDKQWK